MTIRVSLVALLFATMTVTSCGVSGKSPIGSSPGERLPEWETNFTFNGKSIHPAIIHAFEGWISDGGPIVVAIDVAAAEGTNQYRPRRILWISMGREDGRWDSRGKRDAYHWGDWEIRDALLFPILSRRWVCRCQPISSKDYP